MHNPGGQSAMARRQRLMTFSDDALVAGVDEAGRGPLAGPVVAAAVILSDHHPIEGLADSKKLSPRRRDRLAHIIREQACCYGIASADPAEIDGINILQATFLAMERAVAALARVPQVIRIDGNRLPRFDNLHPDVMLEAIVGGDGSVAAISAASILAKVHRDELMMQWHQRYPQYGFDQHKGYGTRAHLNALRQHGACPIHRRSFAPVRMLVEAEHITDNRR